MIFVCQDTTQTHHPHTIRDTPQHVMALIHTQICVLLSVCSLLISHLFHCSTPREPAIQPHQNPSGTHPPIFMKTRIGSFIQTVTHGSLHSSTPDFHDPMSSDITILKERSFPLPPLPPQLLLQVQKTLLKEDAKLTHYKSMNSCQQTTAAGPGAARISSQSYPFGPFLETPLSPQFFSLFHPHSPSSQCLSSSLRRLQSSCVRTS